MATHIFNAPSSPVGEGLLARLSNAVAFFGRTFSFAIAAQYRVEDIRRLQAMSDDELARIGVARDDIVRHVYKDLFHD